MRAEKRAHELSRFFRELLRSRQVGGSLSVTLRLSGAIPFNSLKPFDSRRFADLVAARCCAAAHLAPLHRINHAVTQVLRLRFCHLLLASAQPTG
jgi:hypothetical protein